MTRAGATALVSGGKDSIFAAALADQQGFPVDELVTIEPADPESFLFHTPNLGVVPLQAEAWGKRHRRVVVAAPTEDAEAAALDRAIAEGGSTLVAGAIASWFQFGRLVDAALRHDRHLYVPLWGKSDAIVVAAEIEAGLDIRLIHLSAEPLTRDLLGRRLDTPLLDELRRRSARGPAFHLAGEGGEYETLVVDAPFFGSRIAIDASEVTGDRGTHRLVVRSAHLEPKSPLIR